MIGQAPDNHLHDKKKEFTQKVVHRADSGEEEGQSCAAGPKLCAQNNFKKCGRPLLGIPLPQENACEATSMNLEFGFGIGSRSSRRLQWARHAHNKCIASGHILRVRRGNISARAQRICGTEQQL